MIISRSDKQIEDAANDIRGKLKMEYVCALDMETVLARLSKRSQTFSVRKAIPGELEDDEAFMNCETHEMLLSPIVYEELKANDRRARFTAAHELGHFVLGHKGNTRRTKDKSKYLTPVQKLQESEADRFAAYLLVPSALAGNCKSADEISEKFQVSRKTAEIAFERIEREARRREGRYRELPGVVVDFLASTKKQSL